MRFLRPWLAGALIWAGLSLIVVNEYRKTGEREHLMVLCFLLSLLWMEFGVAGLFDALRKGRRQRLLPLLLVTLLPPLLLCLLSHLLPFGNERAASAPLP